MRSLNLRLQNVPSPPIWGSAGISEGSDWEGSDSEGGEQLPSTWDFIKIWLPNTPEKLAAWIVILQVMKSILVNDHDKKIDHPSLLITHLTPTIQMLAIEQTTQSSPAHKVTPKPKRNSPRHCGSGKKYKHCHGRIER